MRVGRLDGLVRVVAVCLMVGAWPPLTPARAAPPPELARAAAATVRLWSLDAAGRAFADCSGTVVDPAGVILTAWRCVGTPPDTGGDGSGQGLPPGRLFHPEGLVHVGPTLDARRPAVPTFVAVFESGSAGSEVATVRIVRMVDERRPMPAVLGLVALPPSDAPVDLGDTLHRLGYPSRADATVDAVEGTVVGFGSVDGGHELDVVTFDAPAPIGLLGGSAVDGVGRLVGVSTGTGAPGGGRVVLARRALPLVGRGAAIDQPEAALAAGVFGAIAFGAGVKDERLVGESTAFPAGTTEVFARLPYTGMTNGSRWGRVWLLNGQVVVDKHDTETWQRGEEGYTFPSIGDDDGLATGKWELRVYLNGLEVKRGSFTVGVAAATGAAGSFGQPRFGTGVRNGVLAGEAAAFASGTKWVYAVFDFTGLADGVRWGRVWYRNGQIDLDRRDADVWDGGPNGVWSVGYGSEVPGLADGEYELVLYLNGRPAQRAQFSVGTARPGPTSDIFGPIRFGTNVTPDHRPVGETTSFPSNTHYAYASWEYRGARDGMRWGRIWYHNGEIMTDRRNTDVWDRGASGVMSWNLGDEDSPLPDGDYELVLYVDGQPVQRGTFSVGRPGGGPYSTAPPRTRKVRVGGRVVDAATGRPVADARVVLLKPGTTSAQWNGGNSADLLTVAEARTDAAGAFATPAVVPGRTYPLAVGARGYAPIFVNRPGVNVPNDAGGTHDAGRFELTRASSAPGG